MTCHDSAEPGPPYTTDEHLIQNSGKQINGIDESKGLTSSTRFQPNESFGHLVGLLSLRRLQYVRSLVFASKC